MLLRPNQIGLDFFRFVWTQHAVFLVVSRCPYFSDTRLCWRRWLNHGFGELYFPFLGLHENYSTLPLSSELHSQSIYDIKPKATCFEKKKQQQQKHLIITY